MPKKLKKSSLSLGARALVFGVILTLIGVFFVFEASSVLAYLNYKDVFYFTKLQLVWIVISLAVFFFVSRFDYHRWYYFSFAMVLFTLIALVMVLMPGIGKKVGGARRWIDIGFFNFQPSEFAKLSIIIYLSSWFLYKERKRFLSFLILLGIVLFLIMNQPDMGTAMVIFSLSIGIYFVAGLGIMHLFNLLLLALGLGTLGIIMAPYRLRRLQAYLDPQADPLGVGYQITQIQQAFRNGGLFGKGLGFSQQKFLFLPEAHTDSIFAIIAEETGFIGVFFVLLIYTVFLYQIYRIALNAKDRFGKLLASGILLYFIIHLFVNLSGLLNLFPFTGLPVPLISYGGSNLIISFILIGIIYNIGRRL